jgi:hypothetical protein
VVGQQWVRREKGGFYSKAEKLVVTMQKRITSVLLTWCRYYQGVSQKPNSERLSVVPTPGQYYRAPGKNSPVKAYRKYRPSVGTTDKSWVFQKRRANVYVLTLNSSHSLGSSPRALLASLGYHFASPFIVRCFLYSNSKSKIELSLDSRWQHRLGVGGLPLVKTMIFIHLSPAHILIKH